MTTEVGLVERVSRLAEEAERRLEEAKAAHAAAVDEVRRTIFELAATTPPEHRHDCLWAVYWRCPAAKVNWIAEAFGLECGTAGVSRAAGPSYVNAVCGCGAQFKAKLTSRSSGVGHCDACAMAQLEQDRRIQDHREQERAAREARLDALKAMPYAEYLRTPEWQETRRQALRRASYRCQACNGQGRLDVHHRTYERRGNERDRDLTVLCRACHDKFHDRSSLPPGMETAFREIAVAVFDQRLSSMERSSPVPQREQTG